MKRKLLRQIGNEWQSNLWLGIELVIVSVAIWYLTGQIMEVRRVIMLPNGYDTEDVFLLQRLTMPKKALSRELPKDSAAYVNTLIDAHNTLLHTISGRPSVEKVGYGSNITLYNYSSLGVLYGVPWFRDSLEFYSNDRYATPEAVEILRVQPLVNASDSHELAEHLRRGEVLVSRTAGRYMLTGRDENDFFADGLEMARLLVGNYIYPRYAPELKVGAIIEDMRRGRLEPPETATVVRPVKNGYEGLGCSEIVVRVKPGEGAAFREDFNAHPDMFRAEPFYVGEVVSYDEVREGQELKEMIKIRNKVIVIAFLLVSIFLGLLGTFWTRTSNRVSEMAVRRSVGASSADIFRRFIGEGLMILTLATPVAGIIDWAIARYLDADRWFYLESLFHGGAWGHLLLCIAITYAVMALMTVAGILIPARKAMRLDPATALRDE